MKLNFQLWTGRQISCLISTCFKQFKCNRNHVRQFSQTLTIIFPNDKRKLLENENVTYSLIWQVGANAPD